MPGPILYSTNPWIATDIAEKYRSGIYFAWVCEHFDSSTTAGSSPAALIAESSNPREIYSRLHKDCASEDGHSALIKGYKRTFARLAKGWLGDGTLSEEKYDEIIATVRSTSWKIWRPVLYVIPRAEIEAAGRLKSVSRSDRGAYGPELQIADMQRHEFDIIELANL